MRNKLLQIIAIILWARDSLLTLGGYLQELKVGITSQDAFSVLFNIALYAAGYYLLYRIAKWALDKLFGPAKKRKHKKAFEPKPVSPYLILNYDHEPALREMKKSGLCSVGVYSTDDVQGAFSVLNNQILQDGFKVPRSTAERDKYAPRGWPVKNRIVHLSKLRTRRNPQGSTYFYQRTHLIPFRYCNLEDARVTIAGDVTLNSGIMPDLDYVPNINDSSASVQHLAQKASGRAIMNPVRMGYGVPKGAKLSLEDFERYSTRVIKRYPNDKFLYSAKAYYAGEYLSYVEVQFYNISKNKRIFWVLFDR